MSTVEETDQARHARQQLAAAVARGLARWRQERIGDPVPFVVDELLTGTAEMGGFLLVGGNAHLVQESDLRDPGVGRESAEWAVYTEPDGD